VYYNSTYHNCLNIKSEYGAYGNGIYSEGFVLPVGTGLTKYMADARNPAGETSYRLLAIFPDWSTLVLSNTYYLVQYEHMKVCACAYTCGINGFKYAMLWKQYLKIKYFFKPIKIERGTLISRVTAG
jgi:hypothetical protein